MYLYLSESIKSEVLNLRLSESGLAKEAFGIEGKT